jgi:predicted metal-dependent RNase
LPRLVDQGFKGKIYCSVHKKEIAELILLDSGKLKRKENLKCNAKSFYIFAADCSLVQTKCGHIIAAS